MMPFCASFCALLGNRTVETMMILRFVELFQVNLVRRVHDFDRPRGGPGASLPTTFFGMFDVCSSKVVKYYQYISSCG